MKQDVLVEIVSYRCSPIPRQVFPGKIRADQTYGAIWIYWVNLIEKLCERKLSRNSHQTLCCIYLRTETVCDTQLLILSDGQVMCYMALGNSQYSSYLCVCLSSSSMMFLVVPENLGGMVRFPWIKMQIGKTNESDSSMMITLSSAAIILHQTLR